MGSSIEALYIYDELNSPILEHIYRGRPPAPDTLLSHYLAHPTPRPSLLYVPDAISPLTIFSVSHSKLLFLIPSTKDVDPLLVLEFLHRVIDVLEEFICNGGPLLSSKIQGQYEVVAQLLDEMCDGGIVCNTEPNALRELVDVPGWMDKLLGGVGLPNTPSLSQSKPSRPGPRQSPFSPNIGSFGSSSTSAIPWRRSGVRHTSNELYVDIIESLNVTLAPSGRIISAISNGSILFTAKISGVPDLVLSLTGPGGASTMRDRLQLPVFHPCVRLARWRERPGELSFIPPDGRFMLAGYEVDLLPMDAEADDTSAVSRQQMEAPFLPATAELKRGLGPNGSDFEVRLKLNTRFPGSSNISRGGPSRGHGPGGQTPFSLGGGLGGMGSGSASSNAPAFSDDVIVSIPIPSSVRNVTDLRASRGEATFSPGDKEVEWRVPTGKDAGSVMGTATLRGTVMGAIEDTTLDELDELQSTNGEELGETAGGNQTTNALIGYYDAPQAARQRQEATDPSTTMHRKTASLMPNSVSVSFAVRGWVPSGIKVDALNLDMRRSRGVPEAVKPYKGVKYVTVSQKGIERRC